MIQLDLSENTLKNFFPKFIYFLFFAAISALAAPLIYLPLFLIYILDQQISYLISYLWIRSISIILLVVSYKLISKVQSIKNFFLVSLSLVLASLGFYFWEAMHFATSTNSNYAAKLIIIGILYAIYLSGVLTYFWKRIMVNKARQESFLLLLPLVATTIFLFLNTGLLQTYISFGEYLRNNLDINIFYLDFDGFGVVYLTFFCSIIALLTNGLYRVFKE